MAWADPGFERLLLGGDMIDTIERGEMWTRSIVSDQAARVQRDQSTNNLSVVAVAAFAGGILAGSARST